VCLVTQRILRFWLLAAAEQEHSCGMSSQPDRRLGEVFLDARGHGRAMRLTWHHEADLVVLSLWREGTCAGTFRLAKEDVNEFIDALIDGVRDAPGVHLSANETGSKPTEPIEPIETGQSRFPEFTEPESSPAFTDWAFDSDSRANAS
jgi:hypothetical protein